MNVLADLGRDLRYAARTLRKSPAFTIVAVVAIALGIGANSAIFSVVNAVLLQPLPYREPDRLVTVLHDGPRMPQRIKRQGPTSPADYLDWRAQNRVFEKMAAAQAGSGAGGFTSTLTGRGAPEALTVMSVTADLFPLLGVSPLLGRTLGPGDDQPGAAPAVVLGHELWRRRFGGDPAVVGQSIALGEKHFTVVGVMPPGFHFAPFWFTKAEVWLPLVLGDPANDRLADRNGRSLRIFARLAPGVSRSQAQAEMDVIWRQLEQKYPESDSNLSVAVDPLHEKAVGSVRRPLLVLLAAVAFVLLIGCANVANLLLARSAARAKEVALRTALGASRGRLVRQLLAESLLLAVLGGALGVLLAQWGIDALVALGPRDLPRLETIRLDGRVLGFTLGLSLLTGLLFGLVPAWHAGRRGVSVALNEGGRGATEGLRRNRLRSLLVIAEVSLAMVLLIGAGLMIKSFRRLQAVDPGFQPGGLLSLVVQTPAEPARRTAFFDELLARVKALPGVASASAINHLPIQGDVWANSYVVDGRPPPRSGDEPSAVFRAVRPGYFATMGISLAAGRDLGPLDRAGGAPVLIVNETFARTAWPDGVALGRRVTTRGASHEVVGVIRDAKQKDWTHAVLPEMYFPELQQPARGYLTVVVRADGDAGHLPALLQRQVTDLDGAQPVPRVSSMTDVIAGALWQPRFNLLLLNLFAALALVLAAVGIYGVMAYSVSRRTREIGIRVALGATTGQVHKLVVGEGMLLAGLGVLLGLVGALAATRLMEALLFGVTATDPATFAVIALVLLAVALLACYLPARRATRVDPLVALHHD